MQAKPISDAEVGLGPVCMHFLDLVLVAVEVGGCGFPVSYPGDQSDLRHAD
jgi:hypothetical protein